ncbi:nucleotidyltransferase domain-containing protein [Azohydromonas lata]|uniref:nucleotidyltransferase domain-containing protein n=1 Tax=Azohydromonas lata TaxID=45677 RepID=UPI001C3F3D1B|nr:nucleotidyltransferase domain-containing protein [Azohydromonas lata]
MAARQWQLRLAYAMRLAPHQTQAILRCLRQHYGADAQVLLFGSRLDDTARGGDVDLLVETPTPPTLRQRMYATLALEQALGLPVDIVAVQQGNAGSAFVRLARSRAQPLEDKA